MDIRPDLASVGEYLSRLSVYAGVFHQNNVKRWPHLKNNEDFRLVYQLDFEDRRALEKIYELGRDLAVNMSYKLSAYNYADEYPSLTSYIESFSGGWLDEIEDLRKVSDEAKSRYAGLSQKPWAVDQMIGLYDEQLMLLEHIRATLDILIKTDLYRIENGDSPVKSEGNTYNIANVSGRVNVNSTDNSSTISLRVAGSVFSDIRKAIDASNVEVRKKEALLADLANLENSVGQGAFLDKYKGFIESAANHMTVIGPFLPALSKLLG